MTLPSFPRVLCLVAFAMPTYLSLASCGGRVTPGDDGGTGTGTCSARDCEGLARPDDAKVCPDGIALGRTVCRQGAKGCQWDFPDCPNGNGGSGGGSSSTTGMGGFGGGGGGTGGSGGSRTPNGTCPLIPAHDPGTSGLACSLVGRWSLNSSHGNVQSLGVIEFDAAGGYYGGPQGINLDKTYAYDGYYTVSAGASGQAFFDLSYSCGDGCNGSSHFSLQFPVDCSLAIIQEISTQSCTGNRIVVAGTIVLTR